MSSPRVLSHSELEHELRTCPLWAVRGLFLERTFETESFDDGVSLVTAIAALARGHDHHPDIDLRYRSVLVRMTTHDVGGISMRDVVLARAINNMLHHAN
jgi:4a-hydroxytetrahydrobiopterin dehydratase